MRLEQNYRSTQIILDAASAVIRQNRNRNEKRCGPISRAATKILYFRGARRDRGGGLHRPHGAAGPVEDVEGSLAVLYRTNAQSRAIEDALTREGLPTRSSAASGSTSARRSRTRSRTSSSSSTRTTM